LVCIMCLIRALGRKHGSKKIHMHGASLMLLLMVVGIILYPTWTKDDRDDLVVDTQFDTSYILACVSTGIALFMWLFLCFCVHRLHKKGGYMTR